MWSNSGVLGDACQPGRNAHHAGPDPEAKRQYRAPEWVVQAIGSERGKLHLGQQCGPQLGLEKRRRLCRKTGSDGTTCRMQRDGYSIASERGDNGSLIADAV